MPMLRRRSRGMQRHNKQTMGMCVQSFRSFIEYPEQCVDVNVDPNAKVETDPDKAEFLDATNSHCCNN